MNKGAYPGDGGFVSLGPHTNPSALGLSSNIFDGQSDKLFATGVPGLSAKTRSVANTLFWISRSIPNPSGAHAINAIDFGAGGWVMADNTFGIIKNSASTLGNFTWVTRISVGNPVSAIVYNSTSSRWVLLNGTRIFTSTDAVAWVTQTSNSTSQLLATAYGNGIWVAAGLGGAIRTSTDGAVWATQTSNSTTAFYGVAYGNGVWIAAGFNGTIRRSTNNGVTWSTVTSGTTGRFARVAYGNGVFVASGDVTGGQLTLRTSTDGVVWTAVSGITTSFQDMRFANGYFMAISDNSTNTRISVNGSLWVSVPSPPAVTTSTSLAFGESLWTIMGNDNTPVRLAVPVPSAPVDSHGVSLRSPR